MRNGQAGLTPSGEGCCYPVWRTVMMRNAAFATLVALIVLDSGSTARSSPPPLPTDGARTACEVAEAYANEVLSNADEQVIFSDRPFGEINKRRPSVRGWTWQKDRPSPTLDAIYQSAAPTSPFIECDALRIYVQGRGAKVGKDAIDQATTRPPGSPRPTTWGVTIEAFSMPAVSPNGREALLEAAAGCGPLCGATSVVHMRKSPNGFWAITDVVVTGIS